MNSSSTRLSVFCDKALETGWLLAVVITPLFFNVYSSRVFEPDKITILRSIAIVMASSRFSLVSAVSGAFRDAKNNIRKRTRILFGLNAV